jgi:hypothetical protein
MFPQVQQCLPYKTVCILAYMSICLLLWRFPFCVVMSCLHVCQSVSVQFIMSCPLVSLYSIPVCLSSVWCPVCLFVCMTSCLQLHLFEDMLTCLVVWFPDPLLLLSEVSNTPWVITVYFSKLLPMATVPLCDTIVLSLAITYDKRLLMHQCDIEILLQYTGN